MLNGHLYWMISATICTSVSLLELLDRYSYAARFKDVVWNIPGLTYLGINFCIGAAAVPIAQSIGLANFSMEEGHVILSSIAKATLVGVGALGVLRSSFANLGEADEQRQMGFGVFLDRIKAYLDRKIAIQHKMILDTEIAPAMKDIAEARLEFDLPSMCIAGIKCTPEEIDDLRAFVAATYKGSYSSTAKKLLIGHAVCQLCGIEILKAAVKQIVVLERTEVSHHSAPLLESLTNELQAQRNRLIEKGN